jgi:TatD DNase family protein
LITDIGYYSIGIHPWYVSEKSAEKELNKVEKYIQNKNVIALGEIGLDRLYPDFEFQKEIFIKQLCIAQKYSKPVIIHCVKAVPDVLSILKKENVSVPVIFHGFNAGLQIAQQNLAKGYYLSFGKDLFFKKSNAAQVLSQIPLQNIFLETDDSEYLISEIYFRAAELVEWEIEKLRDLMIDNFDRCFNTSFGESS